MSDDSDMSHSGPLAKLVDALCEGEISQTQLAQLEELLHSDAGARNFYIDHMRLVAELEWQQAAGEFPLLLTEDLPPIAEHILEEDEEDEAAEKRKAEELAKIESLAAEKFLAFRREQERHAEPTPAPRNAFFASVPWVAAAAIIGILFFIGRGAEPNIVAKIIAVNGPVWSNHGEAMPPETGLQAGQMLDLEAGLLEIEFSDGARVILEGPARFTVQSRNAGDLQLGKLAAQVPKQAYGFLISTPGMKIVDLGTEFGVVVDVENKSQVRVFAGLVNLQAEDKAKGEIESLLLRPGTTIEVANPLSTSPQANAKKSVFKQVASVPKLRRTLLAKDQKVFADDFSNVPPGRYSKIDTFRQGGTFDFEQGSLNLRPSLENTVAVMLTGPSFRLRRGTQFSADLSANESEDRRVGLLISTFSGQPDGAASFGFRFNFDDQDIWVHVYEKPSDHQVGSDHQSVDIGKGPEAAVHKLPDGPLTLSVEWIGETTFKFYCQSRGSPDRLLIDTRSIEAIKDFSELHVGVQCYRNEDPLVGQCSRLTIGSVETR